MDIIERHKGWYSHVVHGDMDIVELAEITIEYEEEIHRLQQDVTRLVADVLAIAQSNKYMLKEQDNGRG